MLNCIFKNVLANPSSLCVFYTYSVLLQIAVRFLNPLTLYQGEEVHPILLTIRNVIWNLFILDHKVSCICFYVRGRFKRTYTNRQSFMCFVTKL